MVGLGFYFIFFFAFAFWLASTGRLSRYPRFLRIALWTLPLPWLAIESGWFVAEFGRQPWVIEGVLPTFYAASGLTVADLAISLSIFAVLYTALAIVGGKVMLRAIRSGPDEPGGTPVSDATVPAAAPHAA
jgi:cytochrome d ubiquinol oxidase subunit I